MRGFHKPDKRIRIDPSTTSTKVYDRGGQSAGKEEQDSKHTVSWPTVSSGMPGFRAGLFYQDPRDILV